MDLLELKEMNVLFDKEIPQKEGSCIKISAIYESENKIQLEYKFICGLNGVWSTIQDFSEKDSCIWIPKEKGEYMIMVQGKQKDENASIEYLGREKFKITEKEAESLSSYKNDTQEKVCIEKIDINNKEPYEGEKCVITVRCNNIKNMLYRFYIKKNDEWKLLKDYDASNILSYVPSNCGINEILVQCKKSSSGENFEEDKIIKINVKEKQKIQIVEFKSLSKKLIAGNEVEFKVGIEKKSESDVLYKFYKITLDGKKTCIQDYSTLDTVKYVEHEPGKYRMLCLAKELLSEKEYDDRAIAFYEIKPYEDIKIRALESDKESPQATGMDIKFKVYSEGGGRVVYKFDVDGIIKEDSGYSQSNVFLWQPKEAGEYKITVYAKNENYKGECETLLSKEFFIEKRGIKSPKIKEILVDKGSQAVLGDRINIMVKAEGGTHLQYEFSVKQDDKKIKFYRYSKKNWITFTPKESGHYEVVIRTKDKYSEKEYDCESVAKINVLKYLPAKIDYIILPCRQSFIVGDEIEIECIIENTNEALVRYETTFNQNKIEEIEYQMSKKFRFIPKVAGKYVFDIYAKNIKCRNEFDSKKTVVINVEESLPIVNTKIDIRGNNEKLLSNDEIEIKAQSCGGCDILYEFYIMKKNEWTKVQPYSKKQYYTFIPFDKGKFKVLVLAKNFYSTKNYDDYAEESFTVY
ncbi:triple tyrosine motif-containing protein [Clostridium sp. BJN0001]|uniref:triple tyrosine motif-containing protein n=1 Tax=Clostridium sp. BJN0001 TaxID=2930219 RepID=UPI001FD4DCA5|nr:triple tyrosine motif-containing protein [Clostridium sp. BJN0001]